MQCPQCGRELEEGEVACPCGYRMVDASSGDVPNVNDLPPGTDVNGRYRIKTRLGGGTMGVVYLATDQQERGRKVALKFIRGELRKAKKAYRAFNREVKICRDKLRHEHIVTIFDRARWREYDYLVMQFVDGETLADRLKKRRPLEWETVAAWARQLLDALAHAHKKGVIHRDLKPENIMLGADESSGLERLIIMDFGQAKLAEAEALISASSIHGTKRYIAPEELENPSAANAQADLFAVGMILYELLAGHTLVPGKPVPLARLRSGLPGGVEEWLSGALEHDLAKRYEKAEAMLDAMPKGAAPAKKPAARALEVVTPVIVAPPPRLADYPETHAGLNLDMVWIQGGEFQMGSRLSPEEVAKRYSGDPDWFRDEHPHHLVELDGFWLGKYEVTQQQYEQLMEVNPSHFPGRDNPVECVSWENAAEFCRKLSEATGREYVLPTEAQWEFGCRAGSESEWCFGDDVGQLGEYAWYDANSGGRTHPVGEKRPNAWGVHDMHGNVWEWCQDWYDAEYYAAAPKRNPLNGSRSGVRVLRGGGWGGVPGDCRSAGRSRCAPDGRGGCGGFRVVRTQK